MLEIIAIVLYIILSCSGLCFMKADAAGGTGIKILSFYIGIKMLIGMLCYGISFIIYAFVISRTQISIMIPLLAAVNSCIIVFAGWLLFGESINMGQGIGISVVVAGTLIIGFFSRG